MINVFNLGFCARVCIFFLKKGCARVQGALVDKGFTLTESDFIVMEVHLEG